jgi:SAM-dependent methyltransferase
VSREWFEVAFDDLYVELYAHRDEAEAERAIAWIAQSLAAFGHGGLAGCPVLDLACGTGRHLAALARRGAVAVGVDLSAALLARARARARAEGRGCELIRGDLRRLPVAARSFGLALSMFTSLGYFEAEAENHAALSEVARILYPHGWFAVDYLNAEGVVQDLVPRSAREVGEYRVEEERRIDPERGRILKEVRVSRRMGGEAVSRYVESVALWTRAQLEARLTGAGFAVRAVAGDYDGGTFTPGSPRLLLLAERVLADPPRGGARI